MSDADDWYLISAVLFPKFMSWWLLSLCVKWRCAMRPFFQMIQMHHNALLLTFNRPCKIAFYSNSQMQVAADIVLKLIETPASSLLLPHSTQEWLGVVRRLTPSPSPTKSHALLIPPIPPCKPSPALRLDPPCHWLASKSRSSKRNCFGSSHVPKWFGVTVIVIKADFW